MTSYPYHLNIESSVSADYDIMCKGYTDAICIIGFADCGAEYYGTVSRVTDMNQALSVFTGDESYSSTLVQGMLEVYNVGCRDIYLYPLDPMSEFLPVSERDSSWWTYLAACYIEALDILSNYDDIDVLIPYDADITEGEFVTQFAEHCNNLEGSVLRLVYFNHTGEPTATFEGEDYHIILVDGTGIFNFPDASITNYSSGMAATLAGSISKLDTPVPPDNRVISSLLMFTSDYLDDEEALELNRIVGFRKTAAYKRVYNTTLYTTLCFTRAEEDSDFHTLYAVHTIQRFLREVDKLELIGSAAYLAKDSLYKLFNMWEYKGYAQSVGANIVRSGDTLTVDVTLVLPYPVGTVDVFLIVGPVL